MGEKATDIVAGASRAATVAELLDALARFQSAALLYPPTHRRIEESSAALVAALRQAADLRGQVRLELNEGRLLHDGTPIVDLNGPARKLVGDWDTLGVAKLAFLPSLEPADLVAFARFLKEATTQIVGGHRPTLASFELVPRSIDIVSRDYGRPHRGEETRPLEPVDPNRQGGGGSGTGGGTGDGVGSGRHRAPVGPLDDEERAAREWTAQRDAATPELAVDALATALRFDEAPLARARFEGEDRVAAIAWALHLLGRTSASAPGRAALEVRLAELVRNGCRDDDEKALVNGLMAMAKGESAAELATTLDAVTPVLRSHSPERAAVLLLALYDGCGVAARRVLWLRLAQELLLTLGPQGETVERKVGRVLQQVTAAEYEEAAAPLAQLPVIREKRYVRGAFSPARRELYGLYRALARIGGDVGGELLQAFAQRPPVTPAGAAFFALRDDSPAARGYLERYLAGANGGPEEAALRRQAGTILRAFVETLEPVRRGEPWVAAAIAGLARLSSPETDATLARIRRERRMLLFAAWPKACRAAARPGGGA
jgi:hypothetical protein